LTHFLKGLILNVSKDLLHEIQCYYIIYKRLSIPLMQRKWKLSWQTASEIAKYLKVK
jgi:hypothetical protein